MRPDPEPTCFTIHPVMWGVCLIAGALLWCASFKILAALCRATMGVN